MLLDAEYFITLSEGIQVGQASSFFLFLWLNVSHKHFSHTNQMKSSRDSVSPYFNGSISHNGVKTPLWPVFSSVLFPQFFQIYASPMMAVPLPWLLLPVSVFLSHFHRLWQQRLTRACEEDVSSGELQMLFWNNFSSPACPLRGIHPAHPIQTRWYDTPQWSHGASILHATEQ